MKDNPQLTRSGSAILALDGLQSNTFLFRTIFNGNGKLPSELRFAIDQEVLVNCDSEFDLKNIAAAAQSVGKPARVMIRINPDIDPEVHPYISTGLANSKFGIRNSHLQASPVCANLYRLTPLTRTASHASSLPGSHEFAKVKIGDL